MTMEPGPLTRCRWVEGGNDLYVRYHDEEWGVPLHDDARLFEFLVLEGAQAGLSWATVLNKREAYRRAFHDFDIAKVARMTDAALEKRLLDPGIIRNRQKIWSARNNARATLKVVGEFGSLDAYFWSFVDGKPIRNRRRGHGEVPSRLQLRRLDDRLRAHAGDRDGQRPPRLLLPRKRSLSRGLRTRMCDPDLPFAQESARCTTFANRAGARSGNSRFHRRRVRGAAGRSPAPTRARR